MMIPHVVMIITSADMMKEVYVTIRSYMIRCLISCYDHIFDISNTLFNTCLDMSITLGKLPVAVHRLHRQVDTESGSSTEARQTFREKVKGGSNILYHSMSYHIISYYILSYYVILYYNCINTVLIT